MERWHWCPLSLLTNCIEIQATRSSLSHHCNSRSEPVSDRECNRQQRSRHCQDMVHSKVYLFKQVAAGAWILLRLSTVSVERCVTKIQTHTNGTVYGKDANADAKLIISTHSRSACCPLPKHARITHPVRCNEKGKKYYKIKIGPLTEISCLYTIKSLSIPAHSAAFPWASQKVDQVPGTTGDSKKEALAELCVKAAAATPDQSKKGEGAKRRRIRRKVCQGWAARNAPLCALGGVRVPLRTQRHHQPAVEQALPVAPPGVTFKIVQESFGTPLQEFALEDVHRKKKKDPCDMLQASVRIANR